MLRDVAETAHAGGVTILLVHVHEAVRDVMDASGFSALVGAEAYLATDRAVIDRLAAPT